MEVPVAGSAAHDQNSLSNVHSEMWFVHSLVHYSKSVILHWHPLQDPYDVTIKTEDLQASMGFGDNDDVDNMWFGNILWTNEAHFSLAGAVNTHNCYIWGDSHAVMLLCRNNCI